MEVRCDKCQARYKVDDARIGPQGLTMRCGKCQNTFKVTKGEPSPTTVDQPVVPKAAAPAKPAAKPAAPAPAKPAEGAATMMFAAPVLPKPGAAPAAPAKPAAAKPAVAKPAAPPPAAPADESAGRTMMFNTGNLKVSPPPAAKAPPKEEPSANATMVFGQSPVAPSKPAMPKATPAKEPESGATMVFGQSPLAGPQKPAMPKATPGISKPADDGAGSTMMFGQAPAGVAKAAAAAVPAAAKAPPPAAKPAPEPEPAAAAPEPEAPAAEPEAPPEPEAAAAPEPAAEPPPEEEPSEAETAASPAVTDEAASNVTSEEPEHMDGGVQAEGAESMPEGGEDSTFDKAPPKGLLIGVGAGVAALILALVAVLVVKKTGKHAPPPAALETLATAQAAADKDSLASLQDAEQKAKDALEVAGPKSAFGEGSAALARVDIQWADALYDSAQQQTDKAQKFADAGNDAEKAKAEARATDFQNQAKAKLKAAFDTVAAAVKADPKNPELELALADYYRAQKSGSNMNKELKKAQALKADDGKVALIQGMAAAQEDDGAEKALPKLKQALAASPQSARIHYRLALAYAAMKDNDNAQKELKETLKLSPAHERAKASLEALAAEQK